MKQDSPTMENFCSAIIMVWFHDEELTNVCSILVDSVPDLVAKLMKAKAGHIVY